AGVLKMLYMTRGLAGLLAATMIVCGASSAALSSVARTSAHALMPVNTAMQAGLQLDGSVAEREAGRALLRRGKAGEALVHLERALQLFKQSGNKLGEASTQDLLGELYDRQGRYDVALQHFQAAHDIYTGISTEEQKQPGVVSVLSAKEGAFNANLMLAKIGGMYYRQGDAEKARAAFSRMSVTKPETNTLKTAQGAQSKVQSKVNKIRGFGARLRGAVSGTPSTSTPGQAADVVTDTVSSVRGPFEAYREAVIYSVYELGMGRVDYLNDQLDSARKHFENVLGASLANLPGIGSRGRTRVFRAAARTSLGDIAFRQSRFADAIKFYAEAAKGAQADERLDLMWPAERGTGRSLWAQAAGEKDATKAAKLREDALAAYRSALATIETIRQGSLRADESRATFLATTDGRTAARPRGHPAGSPRRADRPARIQSRQGTLVPLRGDARRDEYLSPARAGGG
ncbi:MAG: tetratricopeptide repeat protein, partial [Acidobacteria bacterium]|nr:tetratricopeptide repeat protein [Acidobacteriota bacterium]